MFNYLTKITLCTLLISFAGCATSNQNQAAPQADYSTDTITAKFRLDSSSYLDDANIQYQVQVYANKAKGTPDKATLTFLLRPGPGKLFLKSRSLYMRANGKSFKWSGREWYDISNSPPVAGAITTVRLGYDDLITIAEAAKVKGNLGGQDFDWSYNNREAMRQLVAKVDAEYPKNR